MEEEVVERRGTVVAQGRREVAQREARDVHGEGFVEPEGRRGPEPERDADEDESGDGRADERSLTAVRGPEVWRDRRRLKQRPARAHVGHVHRLDGNRASSFRS
jgi:hypothetical protein